MICDVILSKKNNNYIARIKEWPEIVVKDTSRDKAIDKVKSKLLDFLKKDVELLRIDVPIDINTGNPWIDKFGWFKDDPTFNDLEAEIASYREEIDNPQTI